MDPKAGRHEIPRADMRSYRSRIYSNYVNARQQALAPTTLIGLAPRGPYLRRLIRQHFPKDRNATILDLGCGHGALLHFAREAGYFNSRGIDRSAEQVAAARRLGVGEVDEGDVYEALAAQADASLDVVVAFDVIEHFTREELLPFVDEVHRVLKHGGLWIIHVPNAESPFGARIRYDDLTHELAFTRTSLGQLLLSCGFSDVRCFEDVPAVHGVKSAVRWFFWRGFRLVLRFYMAVETGAPANSGIFSQNLLAVARK
jgi:SAM-dependent methyltransferase